METSLPYRQLADAVLIVHFLVVVFVVAALPAVLVGNRAGWRWVNNLWFRLAHLAAIAVVVLQAWLGKYCALTDLESWLRQQAGEAPYTTSFIEYWLQRALYYEAPFWVFVLAYTGFALLVLLAWWRFPPDRKARHGRKAGA